MASDKTIKRRIKSAKNISQITKAMQMVAASKMKKAADRAIAGKAYADKINEMTQSFAHVVNPSDHPLLKREGSGSKLIILISTNKGLCGGLNSNLFRKIHKQFLGDIPLEFVTVGKKGKAFVVRTKQVLTADFSDEVSFFNSVPAVTSIETEGFLSNRHREVYIAYNVFESVLHQTPVIERLLPIVSLDTQSEKSESPTVSGSTVLEPSIDALLDALLVNYLENQVRAAIVQAEASEHSARMMAMRNATENAEELTQALTLEYNKIRQQGITSEISDMVTARLSVR